MIAVVMIRAAMDGIVGGIADGIALAAMSVGWIAVGVMRG